MPKPLVRVAGVPLLETVIRNFVAAGVDELTIIVNERDVACVEWARAAFPALGLDFIVKTTGSSLESFREVSARAASGRLLISTVDAWCASTDFVRFVDAAVRRPREAVVLGVTPLVADEKPLWVTLDDGGRIARIGGSAGDLVTAGMYLVPDTVRALVRTCDLPRLRDCLAWLHREDVPMYGEVLPAVIDVDDATDVALAETLGTRATHSSPARR
jgi:NDP-sugar pyrophosphorylase family protein